MSSSLREALEREHKLYNEPAGSSHVPASGTSTSSLAGYPQNSQEIAVKPVLPGDLLEAIGIVIVRESFELESSLVQKLEKGALVEVIEASSGRRVHVQASNGQQGWVSLTKATGEALLRPQIRTSPRRPTQTNVPMNGNASVPIAVPNVLKQMYQLTNEVASTKEVVSTTGESLVRPQSRMPSTDVVDTSPPISTQAQEQSTGVHVTRNGIASELGDKVFPKKAAAIVSGGRYECLGPMIMRREQDLNSALVKNISAGSVLRILKAGNGRRCLVQDATGLEGWVSVTKATGEQLLLAILSTPEPSLPEGLKIGQQVFWSSFSVGQEYDSTYGAEGKVVGEALDANRRDTCVQANFPWGSHDVEVKWLAREPLPALPGADDQTNISLQAHRQGWACAQCTMRNTMDNENCTACGLHWQSKPKVKGGSTKEPGRGEDVAPRDSEASLKAAHVSRNNINNLGAKLKTASKTGCLSLCDCHLSGLPDEAVHSDMKKLRFIDISSNSVQALPESIGEWVSLKTLNCSKNRLKDIPQAMSSLKKLQKLMLADNLFAYLPACLASLGSLKELNLSGNRLGPRLLQDCDGDETVYEFKKPLASSLEVLDLSRNALEVLPLSLFGVASLCHLVLASNALSE